MKLRAALARYGVNILTWCDIGANVVFLAGNPHETISDKAALARSRGERWGCVLCAVVDFVAVHVFRQKPGHCDRALAVIETPMVREFSDL